MANLFNLQHNLMMALMVVVGKDIFFADNTIGDKPVEELIVKYCQEMLNKGKVQILISDEMGVKGRELAYPDMGDDSLSVESAKALNVFLNFAANTLCTGSDGLSYGKSDLTFYVGKRYYTYDKVTTTDSSNGFVLIGNNNTKITAIYVTESLQTKNLLAQRTEEIAYRGTDKNLYK